MQTSFVYLCKNSAKLQYPGLLRLQLNKTENIVLHHVLSWDSKVMQINLDEDGKLSSAWETVFRGTTDEYSALSELSLKATWLIIISLLIINIWNLVRNRSVFSWRMVKHPEILRRIKWDTWLSCPIRFK